MDKGKFKDLIIKTSEEHSIILKKIPLTTSNIEVVETQVEKEGTTTFWKEIIGKWNQEGRI
ncbi:hypothetical protein J2Z83_000061 [Virgibacillus natechei]|uniref:Uncharacterized protein n=1 Tax=Virgibacillus natechei TaxID=1216297 RepID=A0ABS4IAL7_9BACI|nr:hypothetical protein [Virgibacillus natechei]MBP1967969.1 hypothetical protein [Virgibacillus natechei]UZD14743.1 hypothetical protein OLD84_09685 [Virgibacillus natechei]